VIDWLRIEDVRERRRRSALETLLADRRAADAQAAALRGAEHARAALEQARASHWQATSADPALDVGSLASAAAWGRALDRRIACESVAVIEARARAEAGARAAEASREALRRAAGAVEKASRLAQQARAEGRRRDDARIEACAEDLAAARWAARRARED